MSPVTDALWASLFLPPWWPSSMYFLALSQAPPTLSRKHAIRRPVTVPKLMRIGKRGDRVRKVVQPTAPFNAKAD